MWASQMHELVRSMIGPVMYDATPGTDLSWYRGQHRGVVVWYAIRDNAASRGRTMRVAASFEGRPICLWVHHRGSATHLGAPPEVRTGDPQFDATCEVHGFPSEVIGRVLDARTRQQLAVSDPNERATTSQGCLRMLRTAPPGHPFRLDVAPERVASWFDEVVDLTSRSVRAFDEHHAALCRTQGPAQAQAWVDRARGSERALAATRAAGRQRFNWMLALIVAIPIVGVLVVTVVVLLSFWL